jgi:predicted SAM-dependent methyltransferase
VSAEPVRRLNWGCGGAGVPGWINSDRRSGVHIACCGDIRDGLPLETDSIDYCVSIHALQEVPWPDLVPVLQELRRVLKPGGVLRLALPDLAKGLEAYRKGDRGYFLIPDEDVRSLDGKFILHLLWYSHSRLMFTADFIAEMLRRAGFSEVHPCAFRQTRSGHAGIVELDDREAETLFVEAVK